MKLKIRQDQEVKIIKQQTIITFLFYYFLAYCPEKK